MTKKGQSVENARVDKKTKLTAGTGKVIPGKIKKSSGRAREEKIRKPRRGSNARSTPNRSQRAQPDLSYSIGWFVGRVRATDGAAKQYIGDASRLRADNLDKIVHRLERSVNGMKSAGAKERLRNVGDVLHLASAVVRVAQTDVAGTVARGLFLGLFSAVDALTGDILEYLFERRPALFASINSDIAFGEVLAAKDLDTVKERVLRDQIEILRRKSYPEQFADLGNRFDIKLTAFPAWPKFVEASQRRNLLTHSDGVVSEQYILQCRAAGISREGLPKVGGQLHLDEKYFADACNLVFEVGVKLSHTLWRKVLPDELALADKRLSALITDCLAIEEWERARALTEFAISQQKISSDLARRMFIVDYCQALKWGGRKQEASEQLKSADWSATAVQFQLAEAVLNDRYDDAASLMHEIGNQSPSMTESAYRIWPLFREFRLSKEFDTAYREIFGHSFSEQVEESAGEVVSEARGASATS